MVDFNPSQKEFDQILKDKKEGGPREAGRFLASILAQKLDIEDFKEKANSGEIPDSVNEWLAQSDVDKGQLKQIHQGFISRMSELLDSLERSGSWEGFSGLSEEERWLEIRKR